MGSGVGCATRVNASTRHQGWTSLGTGILPSTHRTGTVNVIRITITLEPASGEPHRPIAAAAIAQVSHLEGDRYQYFGLLDTDRADGDVERGALVEHHRADGVWELVRRVLEEAEAGFPRELVPERHRAFRRRLDGDLTGQRYVDRSASTRVRDRMCHLIADAVERDPNLLGRALELMDSPTYHSAYAGRWREVIAAGPDAVVAVLRDWRDNPLKTDTPFALLGLIDEESRRRIVSEEHR